MCVYYAYRMFRFAPWYDELYTYNFFISRGPVYAGIHWPVPNNHLGYSALSGILYVITHEPYISLRGIAYLASIGNLIILFMIGRRLMTGGFAILLPAVYAGAWQVNTITVQGRGYSLSVNMMLIALWCLVCLCLEDGEKNPRKYYILWAISLILGFYTVMTTLYWVVTLCTAALCCLLSAGKSKRLTRLIITSVCAAAITLIVYGMVWLAIGSNLLIKDEAGAYSGMSHLALIVRHPVLSASTGAGYMLATPYIQSVSKDGYISAFFAHWMDILDHMYSFGGAIVCVMALAVILAAVTLIARRRARNLGTVDTEDLKPVYTYAALPAQGRGVSASEMMASGKDAERIKKTLPVFSWIIICFVCVPPLTVFIQTKLPYVRVFTFYAVTVALCTAYLMYVLFGALKKYFTYGIGIIVAALVFALLTGADYNNPYGDKEEALCTLMKQADLSRFPESGIRLSLTDCDQEYMYRFVYDKYPEMIPPDEADVIVVDKEMLDPDAQYHWEFYYDYTSIDTRRLESMMRLIRNTYYEVYISEDIVKSSDMYERNDG